MEAFEREILRYETASGEGVSDALRIGIVLRQLEETKLLSDENTGRAYFTANGEKFYDKGVQHVLRGTVKGASAPIDVKLR
eukprot:5529271-Amphidinium_carterae.1